MYPAVLCDGVCGQDQVGGQMLRVGSYLLALGGRDRAGRAAPAVSLFDPRRPGVGWRGVDRWTLPNTVQDGCAALTRDPLTGPQVLKHKIYSKCINSCLDD